MDSLYSISVRLGLDATGFSGAAALATTVLQKLEQQAIATSGSTAGLGKSLSMVAGGMALLVGGMAGVHVLESWTTAAGRMQDALTQVGIAAGGTQAQLHALFNQSFGVANQTQYSGSDVLSMDQIMARMGFRDLSGKQTQRQVIGQAIPDFARAAEIIQHFTGTGYQETVTALAQQAHMFGAYSGEALKQNVAWATGAALVSHMTPSQEVNVMRYMAPAVKSGQLTSLDAMTLAALGNQTGLTVGGRAASSIGTLLRELSPNGSKKHDDALAQIERLGGGDFYQHGKLVAPDTWLGILNKFYDATKGDQPLQTYLAKNGLLVQGQQAASVLGSNTSIAQYAAIHAQLMKDTPGWAVTTQGQVNATLPGQLQTLTGNLGSIQSLLGTQLLPALAPVIHGFVELTGGIVSLLTLHPELAQFIVTFTAVSTAAALIAGPILVAAGAFGILSAAGVVTAGAFLPFTATVLGILAAVTLVTFAVTHWGTVMDAFSGKLGSAWQVVSLGAVAIGATIAVGQVASAVFGVLSAATFVLSGGFGVAALAGGALDVLLGGVSAVAAAAAFGYGLLDVAVMALSGGFGIASIAAGALDLLLAPYTIPIMAIIAAVGGAIYVFTHWSQVSTILGNVFGWLGGKLHDFLVMLGLAKNTTPAGVGAQNAYSGGVATTATGATAVPVRDPRHGHYVMAGRMQIWVPDPPPTPGHGGKGGGGAMATAGPTTIHLHVAPGAVVNHIAPGHGHDPAKIAEEVTKKSADALVKGFRDALAHSGTGPSTTLYPTLHRTS